MLCHVWTNNTAAAAAAAALAVAVDLRWTPFSFSFSTIFVVLSLSVCRDFEEEPSHGRSFQKVEDGKTDGRTNNQPTRQLQAIATASQPLQLSSSLVVLTRTHTHTHTNLSVRLQATLLHTARGGLNSILYFTKVIMRWFQVKPVGTTVAIV